MSEASKLWKTIKREAESEWQRIENRLETGFPDCLVLSPYGQSALVEGKYKDCWPASKDTATDLGLRKEQVNFLKRWCRLGGKAWLLARIKDEWLLVWGTNVEYRLTRRMWYARAHKIWESKPDIVEMEGIICGEEGTERPITKSILRKTNNGFLIS